MIIEFTGCTSAGKTKLVSSTLRMLKDKKIPVMMGYDYVLNQFGISIENIKLKSVVVEIMLIPTIIRQIARYMNYFITANKLIMKRNDTALIKFKLIRNLIKQVAVFKFITKHNTNNLYIILDEGTIHSLTNIFVHYNSSPNLDKLSIFLSQIPMPDKIIIVDAPIKMIAARALKRKDAPWKNLTRENWETLAKNAQVVFRELIDIVIKKRRLLLIKNYEGSNNMANGSEIKILNFILEPN